MRYRVQFSFSAMRSGYYYTEWFDTLEEATTFVARATALSDLHVPQIEDEDGEVV